jgi:K(+)-stimulated pyrophosphate-energized sodium pump
MRLFLSFAALLPGLALAAGSEAKVELKFTQGDMTFLMISLGLALLSILVGWAISRWVTSQSDGDDKMREVGAAIRSGAMAYLRQQFKLMAVFVVLLSVGLFFYYNNEYSGISVLGVPISVWLPICFILGVLASYIAGYCGMTMAVAANMRVAAAAQSSYKRALEVGFRAGSVAGLITVGMGLLGATLIFLVAGAQAMKLLIGFGFGGSLAALFMRVGGGIYTKAADVGADLVGKVEAGIPEDDPRNPATIADNVGDNVGDCAGMAADVFESYEVTLVAAIVLGAATAAIFDQATWMKLILFALMARGVGVVASILGILFVRGKDDENMDPLTPVSRGFWFSAAIAAVGTAGVAYVMMGDIKANSYTKFDGTTVTMREIDPVHAKKLYKLSAAIDAAKVKMNPTPGQEQKEPDQAAIVEALKTVKPPAPDDARRVVEVEVKPEEIEGLKADPLMNYMVMGQKLSSIASLGTYKPAKGTQPQVDGIVALEYKQQPPAVQGQPQRPATTGITLFPSQRLEEIKRQPGVTVEGVYPASFGVDDAGKVYVAIDGIKSIEKSKAISMAARLQFQREMPDVMTGEAKSLPDFVMPLAKATRVVEWWRFFVAILFGILLAYVIERLTDYFVSFEKKPVREIAASSSAGPAPMIIQGFAYGMESAVWSVLTIVVALLAPLFIFPPDQFGGFILSFYGIALVGLGLLTTTGYILAMDTFGPISDNAQGVYQMSGAEANEKTMAGSMAGSRAVQRLDAAGNTTKALTKGFAIATAVVAAVALFHSFIEDARLSEVGLRLEIPQIFIGLLIGGAAPFLFSAFAINAVGRASFQLINEVRRQFAADPGIMAGTSKPDYGNCVAIVTAAAQKELLGPGILAIALPILVGFGLAIGAAPTVIHGVTYNLVGAQALGGFLAGAILSAQLLAVTLANSGGAWDNAKKTIEDGMYGGKGTEAHKAGIVCDTVGDPFKDTAGPALNPLIKVMNLVALLLAPVVIMDMSMTARLIIVACCLIALSIAVFWSKRGSIGTELAKTAAEAEAH